MKTKNDSATETKPAPAPWVELVRDRVNGLRFGVVQIVIHEGRVTQIESTERVRLPSASE
ncbi:MAG: YezD family protein [Burkholderiaceae bacterium]|nr:YezD family protein [Burkholderiaceae bacterium]